MHIEYLKIFYEVASARSISKVANSSHISQPALSQQIQRLEDCIGLKLLERSNKGVELTEAGVIVEKYARHLIKAYDNMAEDLGNIKKNNNNTFRIDASPVIATYALPCTIYKVKEQYPTYNFNLTSDISHDVEQNVINDVSDIGFLIGKSNDKSLECSKIGTDRIVAVASEAFDIKQNIYCKDILKYPLILIHEKSRIRRELNGFFNKLGYNLENFKVLFNMDSTESVKSSVIKGHGLSFLPYISVKKELYTKQLKEIKVLDFNLTYDIYMIYKKDKEMCRSVKELIQYIKKVGEKSFC